MAAILICNVVACAEQEPPDEEEPVSVTEMKLVTPQCTHAGVVTGQLGPISVPLASNGSSTCFMESGDVSSGVLALQRALKFCWGQNIATDSDYGSQTKQAVRNLQKMLGISADGVYGPQTHLEMGDIFADPNTNACI
jgi:peptidoglycan hydrolase-like protein with peptidoglycan-binding domain